MRNAGRWTNPFYDDIAWLGIALQRGDSLPERGLDQIAARLESAIDSRVGAIPWRIGSALFNAPANGPAAIVLARTGRVDAAARLADWLDATLRDEATGLIRDGIEPVDGIPTVRSAHYTYCQGVALAAQLEVAGRRPGRGTDGERFLTRAIHLVEAIETWTRHRDAVLPGAGGGDGGLFAGITCRTLAWAARRIDHIAPTLTEGERAHRAATTARSIVQRNAEALWAGRAEVNGRPIFSVDAAVGARVPTGAQAPLHPTAGAVGESTEPERDLSVQLGAWLTFEAAVAVFEA